MRGRRASQSTHGTRQLEKNKVSYYSAFILTLVELRLGRSVHILGYIYIVILHSIFGFSSYSCAIDLWTLFIQIYVILCNKEIRMARPWPGPNKNSFHSFVVGQRRERIWKNNATEFRRNLWQLHSISVYANQFLVNAHAAIVPQCHSDDNLNMRSAECRHKLF